MITGISVSGMEHLTPKTLGFVQGLNTVCGPVGSGKSMVLRDCLFLLLTGRVPGTRTLSSLGKKSRMTLSLRKEGEDLTILRQGSSVSVLQDSSISTASAVKEKVASFTGVSTSDLVDTCYVSGLTLPASVLTPGALLNTVREFAGTAGLQAFAREVNSEKSSLTGKMAALNAGISQAEHAGDCLEAAERLEKIRAELSSLAADLEARKADEQRSRVILGLPVDTEVAGRIQALSRSLGPLLAAQDPEGFLDRISLCRSLADLLFRDVSGKAAEEAVLKVAGILPSLGNALKEAFDNREMLGADTGRMRQDLLELRRLRGVQTVPEKSRGMAVKYVEYCDSLRSRLNELQSEQIRCRGILEGAAGSREAVEKRKLEVQIVSKQIDTLSNALDFLQPGGRHSVEKKVVETVMGGLLGRASGLLSAAGLSGRLEYSADDGLSLVRESSCPVAELSGGEITLASLVLHLAQIERRGAVPFLVLDDITGPLGRLVPGTCDMLRGFVKDTGIPVILITHMLSARGDHFIKF